MSIVTVEDLSYSYPEARTPALERVNLRIEPGEFVVIAGSSGSGKSSLLRAIAGLVPHFYGGRFAGTVMTAGRSTREHGPGELAAGVGSLFQDPETQIVLGTPRAELTFGLENRGLTPAAIARAVEETSLALAIEPLLDRPTDQLSGGELQRVALGATLAVRPSVVCLDEPTSQLDPVAGDELVGLLRRLNDDRELTVLLAEHRLERCLPYADRVIAMDRGAVAFDGHPEAFLEWSLCASPALATPGAKLLGRLGLPPRAGVRRARTSLREASFQLDGPGAAALAGQTPVAASAASAAGAAGGRGLSRRRRSAAAPWAIQFTHAWHELRDGPVILRDLCLIVAPGERVALMGRNGAGKSTLLRHAAGLLEPTRGTVRRSGRVALVLQNPNDYLVHETVAQEATRPALTRFGLDHLADRHPRDLSGGERQRLALAIVLGAAGEPGESTGRPSAVCLDEPTRGMDRAAKDELARTLRALGAAVVVATHDPEFAAAFADRVVLLADGSVIATGSTSEVLSGGTYFATETARILGGDRGVLLPDDGAALLIATAEAQLRGRRASPLTSGAQQLPSAKATR